MVDREVLDARLGRLEEQLRGLRGLAAGSREAFLADRLAATDPPLDDPARWGEMQGDVLLVELEFVLDAVEHWRARSARWSPATVRDLR